MTHSTQELIGYGRVLTKCGLRVNLDQTAAIPSCPYCREKQAAQP